jgi:hypothetical protein
MGVQIFNEQRHLSELNDGVSNEAIFCVSFSFITARSLHEILYYYINSSYNQYLKFQKQHRQLIFKRRRLAALIAIAAFVAIVMGVQIFNEQRHLSDSHIVIIFQELYVLPQVSDSVIHFGRLSNSFDFNLI